MSFMELDKFRDILKTCGEFQVKTLKLGNLYLEFDRPESLRIAPPPATEIAAQESRSALQDEQKQKQEEIANMQLENPELYEDLLLNGELTDEPRSD